MFKRIALALIAATMLHATTPAVAADYLVNTKSGKFHYATCRTIKHPDAPHFIHFSSASEAQDAGYVACGVCKPR